MRLAIRGSMICAVPWWSDRQEGSPFLPPGRAARWPGNAVEMSSRSPHGLPGFPARCETAGLDVSPSVNRWLPCQVRNRRGSLAGFIAPLASLPSAVTQVLRANHG